MLTYILLLLGFIFLIKGAELLVDGASSLAKRFRISDIVIGLTIVAFGTSAPELIVNILASFQGATDISIGNILGSNIANILLIGGIAAMIYPIKVKKGTVWKEIPISLFAVLFLVLVANDFFIPKVSASVISRLDGLVLIGFFLVFLYYTFGIARVEAKDMEDYEKKNIFITLAYIIIGITGLTIGGKWIIDSVLIIGQQFGLSEALLGLTVVAIGTSLPELATSAVAAFKKNADLAIGNIVGSNIFNIFWILGVSAIIRPLTFNPTLNTDALVAIGATLILFYFILTGKEKRQIERWEGVVLFCFYLIYISFLMWRG
ncbi:calcium/sodium antiporter [Candidatus Falkowbacteria bacterium]|uniref:Sodium:proton exchanger n=1 Tax=Candidatus Buchananbacteria bacterium CG10_big_fil_rev_8_21_14_0_10_33_19 TaxID=1974525 RepID=A0A2H0W470_9BACT|nr:calcium/sodium antiporter [Candidatus Falkowbacteria bacterium]PIS06104.1 MAG: sodium:proton exchanger [Candidatus Buchananbacteria bacterium CG10_big_fil_rev_8_21_14_0_10_33_19]